MLDDTRSGDALVHALTCLHNYGCSISGNEISQNRLGESLAGIWGGKNVGTPTMASFLLSSERLSLLSLFAYAFLIARCLMLSFALIRTVLWCRPWIAFLRHGLMTDNQEVRVKRKRDAPRQRRERMVD